MKNFFAILSLLLALLMLLTSCAGTKTPDTQGTTESTSADTTEDTTPKTINGIWYSKANQTVLDTTDLSNVTFYQLVVGYYKYQDKITAPCTYEDYILTMTIEEGETLSWVFDAQSGTLKANNGSDSAAYTQRQDLPTEYKRAAFPSFASMDCNTIVTPGSYTGLTSLTNANALAAKDIFDSFYQSSDKHPATITDRVATDGDYVNIDYTGYLNDVAFENGAAQGADVLIDPNSGYIPGFAEQIAGHAVGTTFDVKVTFPTNYQNTELAGKDVVFRMTLNKIYYMTISDTDIAEYTEGEYATYQEMLQAYADQYIFSDLMEQIIEKTTYESIPEEAYLFFYQYYSDMYHYYAFYYSMEYEAFLSAYGLTDNMLIENAKDTACQYLVIYAIAQSNNLEITDTEFAEEKENYIQSLMESEQLSYEEAKESVEQSGTQTLHADLMQKKVMNWLLEKNQA